MRVLDKAEIIYKEYWLSIAFIKFWRWWSADCEKAGDGDSGEVVVPVVVVLVLVFENMFGDVLEELDTLITLDTLPVVLAIIFCGKA